MGTCDYNNIMSIVMEIKSLVCLMKLLAHIKKKKLVQIEEYLGEML